MESFSTFRSMGIPIDILNCDTDQIIPARFLRSLPEDGGSLVVAVTGTLGDTAPASKCDGLRVPMVGLAELN